MEVGEIKKKVDEINDKITTAAATFMYNPDELTSYHNELIELQSYCNHEYENGKCKYCRKGEE